MKHRKIYTIVLVIFSVIAVTALAFGLTQDEFCVDADNCTPSGAHGGSGTNPAGHFTIACSVCHKVGGRLAFDKTGPAYGVGLSAPTFDATAKTCSNISCHSVAAGTFSYYTQGSDPDYPELVTVNYGGGPPPTTPSWYSPGSAACSACHGNPPAYLGNYYAWHSGLHANNMNVGSIGPNACELCHNDTTQPWGTWVPIALSAVGTDGKVHGYQINPAVVNGRPAVKQHANGTATVLANFRSVCYNCH